MGSLDCHQNIWNLIVISVSGLYIWNPIAVYCWNLRNLIGISGIVGIPLILTESLEYHPIESRIAEFWQYPSRSYIWIMTKSSESCQTLQNLSKIFGISLKYLKFYWNLWNDIATSGIFGISPESLLFLESLYKKQLFSLTLLNIQPKFLKNTKMTVCMKHL